MLTPDLVQLLVMRCLRLADLSLSLWPATAVAASGASGNGLDLLLGLLHQCTALTSLSLYTSVYDGDLMTEMVLHLATRSKLTHLYIAVPLSHSTLTAACSALHLSSANPIAAVASGLAVDAGQTGTGHDLATVDAASDNWFPDLRRLDVTLETKSVPLLFAMMNREKATSLSPPRTVLSPSSSSALPALTALKLKLADTSALPPTALSVIARYLRGLRSLKVSWGTAVALPPAELLALRALPHLHELVLNAGGTFGWSQQLTLDKLTDDDFTALAAGLPRLRSLGMRGQGRGLTVGVLRRLGQHCRMLEELDLGGTWDMSSWQEKDEGEGPGGSDYSYYSDGRDGSNGSSGSTRKTGPLFPRLTSLRLDDVHLADSSDGAHDR